MFFLPVDKRIGIGERRCLAVAAKRKPGEEADREPRDGDAGDETK
jgi:hypothetical protein